MNQTITESTAASPRDRTELRLQCAPTESFLEWLAHSGGSLAVTTYQAGMVALAGWNGRQMTLLARHFAKPMGLAVDGPRLALACRYDVLHFASAPLLAPEYLRRGQYDALYLPRAAYFTGDLATHDLAFGQDGLWIVNTRFSCLAALSHDFSFKPRWRPPFISELAPEDRCHLNGLAMRDGRPAFVTALGESNEPGGWRENKASGGVIIDVAANELVLRGLSMPHSPRWHDGRLWFLNSGTGELCRADLAAGGHEVIAALPGYMRGLTFVGEHALVGMCKIRERHSFGGLPVQERHEQLECGIAVIELQSGREIGRLEFTAGCTELYDVQFLPGVRRPTILNLDKPAARRAITAPEFAYWLSDESIDHDPGAPESR